MGKGLRRISPTPEAYARVSWRKCACGGARLPPSEKMLLGSHWAPAPTTPSCHRSVLHGWAPAAQPCISSAGPRGGQPATCVNHQRPKLPVRGLHAGNGNCHRHATLPANSDRLSPRKREEPPQGRLGYHPEIGRQNGTAVKEWTHQPHFLGSNPTSSACPPWYVA